MIRYKELLKKYSDGIICLSTCLAGEIPKKIVNNKDLYKNNSDYNLYYYGLNKVNVKVDGKIISLERKGAMKCLKNYLQLFFQFL